MEEIVRKAPPPRCRRRWPPGRGRTKKKKTERRREARGFYIKGEGRVWFAEIRGFSNDL